MTARDATSPNTSAFASLVVHLIRQVLCASANGPRPVVILRRHAQKELNGARVALNTELAHARQPLRCHRGQMRRPDDPCTPRA